MGQTKWFLRSKTVWVNLLVGAAFAVGLPVPDSAASPDALQAVGVAATAGNGLMRFVTREALGSYGKRALSSKTVWLNIALLVGAAMAAVGGAPSVSGLLIGIAVVNLWLRKITSSPVSLSPHPFRGRSG